MKNLCFSILFVFIIIPLFSQVEAGNADTVCSDRQVNLHGSVRGNEYLFYHWKGNPTLSDSTNLQTIVQPDTTTTYYLYAYRYQSNVVSNGDFEQGNVDFTSSYYYNSISLVAEGTYAVVSNAHNVHPYFNGPADHTLGNGTGHYMAVNGSPTPNVVVWAQSVNVTPHTDYIFHTWVYNLGGTQQEASVLQFSINNALIGNVFTAPYPASSGWQQFSTIWNSRNNSSAEIKIINQSTVTSGNDFGLDDIHFTSLVADVDSVTVFIGRPITLSKNVTVCDGLSYEFNGRILSSPGTYYDTLQTALGCDSTVILYLNFGAPVTVELGENQMLCKDNDQSFILNPGTYANYLWSDSSTNATLTVDESGTYSVTVSDTMGCSATDSVLVEFRETPQVYIQNNSGDFCEEFKANLSAITDINADFLWNTGEETQTIMVNASGLYSVTADNQGCMNTAIYNITPCAYNLILPDCFTPTHQDGLNDYFKLPNPEQVKSLEIFIYNKFGELVFHSMDPYFIWDGRYKGKICYDTTYGYVLQLIPKGGKQILFKGCVTVL